MENRIEILLDYYHDDFKVNDSSNTLLQLTSLLLIEIKII